MCVYTHYAYIHKKNIVRAATCAKKLFDLSAAFM